MAIAVTRLPLLLPADLSEAFKPLIQALPAARAAALSSPLVTTAENSVKLKNSVSSFSQARNRLSATVAGTKTVSCELLRRGTADFNRIAGSEAVTYTEQERGLARDMMTYWANFAKSG